MQKILGKVRSACERYNLINDGDKIAVGVSGGKDSLTLLTALALMKKFYPKKYEVVGIAVDMFDGDTDYTKIKDYCKNLNVEFYVEKSNIKEVVFDIKRTKSPCSLCANLRRGVLNSKAHELGCNKVALGHHSNDLVETFFLSMFYEGRLNVFSPKTYMTKADVTVIRPLILAEEKDIFRVSKGMPVLKNNCPANHKTQREEVKKILADLEKKIPNVEREIFSALTHPERNNLFDKFDLNKKED